MTHLRGYICKCKGSDILAHIALFISVTAVNRQGPVKRKSDSSDDQIFDEEEMSREPQQKRVAPSPWITAKKEEAPPVAVKRKKSDQGECFTLFSRISH
jgi:hypothetical protein